MLPVPCKNIAFALIFLVNQQKHDFTYAGHCFRTIAQSKSLVDNGRTDYGVDTIIRGGLPIKLTSLERSIVDVLDRPDLFDSNQSHTQWPLTGA